MNILFSYLIVLFKKWHKKREKLPTIWPRPSQSSAQPVRWKPKLWFEVERTGSLRVSVTSFKLLHLILVNTQQNRCNRSAYPKILLSVLQTACIRIFRFLARFFCGYSTNQSKQKSVKGQFFFHSYCKNSVWTHIFNYTDAPQNWHTMTLGCLHFVYIC